MLFLLILLYH